MSGEGYGTGEMGADSGFGYLDDDDDDGAGSTVPASFAASISDSSFFEIAPTNGTVTFTLATSAAGASQTLGLLVVKIGTDGIVSDYSSPISSITTGTLAGWSEAGWSYWNGTGGPLGDGSYWYNTFTKATVSIGSTSIVFTATASGSVSDGATNVELVTDQTAQASGPPQSYVLDFKVVHMSAAATSPGTVNQGSTFSTTINYVNNDVGVTTIAFTVQVLHSDGTSTVTTSISTTTLQFGWTETGWSISGNYWVNTFHCTIAPPGGTATHVIGAPVPVNAAIHGDYLYVNIINLQADQYSPTSGSGSATFIN